MDIYVVKSGDTVLTAFNRDHMAPGEMEQVILQKKDLIAKPDIKTITIKSTHFKTSTCKILSYSMAHSKEISNRCFN